MKTLLLAAEWFYLQCAQSVKVKYRRHRAVISLLTVKGVHGEHRQAMTRLTQFNSRSCDWPCAELTMFDKGRSAGSDCLALPSLHSRTLSHTSPNNKLRSPLQLSLYIVPKIRAHIICLSEMVAQGFEQPLGPRPQAFQKSASSNPDKTNNGFQQLNENCTEGFPIPPPP